MRGNKAKVTTGKQLTMFEERERAEENRYKHDEELAFKVRNRRNRLFGIWLAETHLSLTGDAATAYGKQVMLADLEAPGDDDMLRKVEADLAAKHVTITAHTIQHHLARFGIEAKTQVMAE